MFKPTCFLQLWTCLGLLQVVKCWKAGTKSKWHCVLHTAPTPGPGLIPSPKTTATKSKLEIIWQLPVTTKQPFLTCTCYRNESHFQGSFISRMIHNFFVTQTHHPIPAPSQKESGVKTSRHGHILQEDLRGQAGRPERDGGSPGPSHKMEHVFQWQCSICPSRKLAVMLKLYSSAPRLIYLFFYKWYSPHPRLCFCFIYCI